MRLLRTAVLLALVGCTATVPSGRYRCTTTADCPPEMSCQASLCVLGGMDAGAPIDAAIDSNVADGSADAPTDPQNDASNCVEATIESEADTSLVPGSCNGALYLGGERFISLSTGLNNAALYRFHIDDLTRAAFLDGRVAAIELRLSPTTQCGGDMCPTAHDGQACLRVATSDWTEGPATHVDSGGADWCRRNGNLGPPIDWDQCLDGVGPGCGAGGANSGGAETCVSWSTSSTSITIPIDLASFAADIASFASVVLSGLTLRVTPVDSLVFVSSTHESSGVHPQLALTICD